MTEQLCKESDSNLEKIKKLEEELVKRGFSHIDNIRSSQHISSIYNKSYECFVLVPNVGKLTEEASTHFERKYVSNLGLMKVYALSKK